MGDGSAKGLPDQLLHPPPEDYPLIAGNNLVFSSYPGTIFSGDDFYILGSGLVSGSHVLPGDMAYRGSGLT